MHSLHKTFWLLSGGISRGQWRAGGWVTGREAAAVHTTWVWTSPTTAPNLHNKSLWWNQRHLEKPAKCFKGFDSIQDFLSLFYFFTEIKQMDFTTVSCWHCYTITTNVYKQTFLQADLHDQKVLINGSHWHKVIWSWRVSNFPNVWPEFQTKISSNLRDEIWAELWLMIFTRFTGQTRCSQKVV